MNVFFVAPRSVNYERFLPLIDYFKLMGHSVTHSEEVSEVRNLNKYKFLPYWLPSKPDLVIVNNLDTRSAAMVRVSRRRAIPTIMIEHSVVLLSRVPVPTDFSRRWAEFMLRKQEEQESIRDVSVTC